MATLRMMPRPIFLLILNALYKSFQMRYHLFQKFFGKMVKIKEASFLFTRGMTLMFGNCTPLLIYFIFFSTYVVIWILSSVSHMEVLYRQLGYQTEDMHFRSEKCDFSLHSFNLQFLAARFDKAALKMAFMFKVLF